MGCARTSRASSGTARCRPEQHHTTAHRDTQRATWSTCVQICKCSSCLPSSGITAALSRWVHLLCTTDAECGPGRVAFLPMDCRLLTVLLLPRLYQLCAVIEPLHRCSMMSRAGVERRGVRCAAGSPCLRSHRYARLSLTALGVNRTLLSANGTRLPSTQQAMRGRH